LAPLDGGKEDLFHAFDGLLAILGIPWLVDASL
jgi:hypothetical protein